MSMCARVSPRSGNDDLSGGLFSFFLVCSQQALIMTMLEPATNTQPAMGEDLAELLNQALAAVKAKDVPE
jgi:hypothetical protein